MGEEIQKNGEELSVQNGLELQPIKLKQPSLLEKAKKIPVGNVAMFGAAFASMPQAMRQATTAAEGLYRLVPMKGAEGLKLARKGSDKFVGILKMKDGGSKYANFMSMDNVSTTLPYDPTTFAVAVALAEINQKLDSIKELQEDMFEYMRQKDAGARRGDLEYLVETLDNYCFYWESDTDKAIRGSKVQDVKRAAMQDVAFLKSQIESKLNKERGLFQRSKDAGEKTSDVLDMLREYQISVHLFSFSSLLEALLRDGHDPEQLEALASKVDERGIEYREVYTLAYNMLEKESNEAIEHVLLKGISAAGRAVGEAIEKTPVGDKTLIDEAFVGIGDRVGKFKDKRVGSLMGSMPEAKMVDVKPFAAGIRNLSELSNRETEVLTDGESIYLVPVEAE